jgi:hypothetical protein
MELEVTESLRYNQYICNLGRPNYDGINVASVTCRRPNFEDITITTVPSRDRIVAVQP